MSFGAPGSFNTGTDQIVTITCPNSSIGPAVLSLDGRRERFTSKENAKVEMDAPCDNGGVIDIVRIPETWTGSIETVRQSDNFAAVIAALDQEFFNGLEDTAFTIVSEEPARDGSGDTAIYQYQNVHFHDYDAGDWARGTKVKCTVSFTASLRVKLQ